MQTFTKYNNLFGWVVFCIASGVYLLTMEPSVSLWDCGEFIASAFKLEVGHPPGAPLFMLVARLFAIVSGEASRAAMFINAFSALASAATIMFLFWTITHLSRKLIKEPVGEWRANDYIMVLGSGLIGSLAYTFSDTFWFSAVEGEVYATSSLFTALVFWAILKWENVADEPHANRWIVLIAYLMGLSIGVHLLNLLAIPALVMVYYFKKYRPTTRGVVYALLLSVVILGFVMYGIIQGLVKGATLFERIFVNGFHLPFNSGNIFYAIVIIGAIVWGIRYCRKKGHPLLHLAVVSVAVILIGYSSYAAIVIRSHADPPMDENNPDNVFALLAYLNREQYGDRPLLKGHYYNAPAVDTKKGAKTFSPVGDKYIVTNEKTEYIYDKRFVTLFPRMYSPDPQHIEMYREWGGSRGTPIKVDQGEEGIKTINKPTFAENLRFFITYQVGHMYWRYFMWNFAGRQNDTQNQSGIINGNWISGIDAIDSLRLGNQSNLPDELRNVPSRNRYFMLPFILGIIGMFFQYNRSRKDFLVVGLLFVLTGLAIVVYLNQTPLQPRERDYAYAGSFYAFAIWIGIGLMALINRAQKFSRSAGVGALVFMLCLGVVPGLMAAQNWDDHDRSGRFFARDMAYNYLNTCEKNAILFTNGDNDTFPLWYIQEVEEVRTDVRVCNLMLLNTDWYIDQMKRKAYTSEPLPIAFTKDQYRQGTRDVVYVVERLKDPVDIRDILDFVRSSDPKTKLNVQGMNLDYIPTRTIRIPVNKNQVLASGTVDEADSALIVPYIDLQLRGRYIGKGELMVLDMLANNDWTRPIYYASGGHEGAFGLEPYFRLEGFAYRLVPVRKGGTSYPDYGFVDANRLYHNLMETFRYGRMNEPDVYLDHFTIRTLSVLTFRNLYSRLASELTKMGRTDSARRALEQSLDLAPAPRVPYDQYSLNQLETLYAAGANETGDSIASEIHAKLKADGNYLFGLGRTFTKLVDYEKRYTLSMMQELVQTGKTFNRPGWTSEAELNLQTYYSKYMTENGKGNP